MYMLMLDVSFEFTLNHKVSKFKQFRQQVLKCANDGCILATNMNVVMATKSERDGFHFYNPFSNTNSLSGLASHHN